MGLTGQQKASEDEGGDLGEADRSPVVNDDPDLAVSDFGNVVGGAGPGLA